MKKIIIFLISLISIILPLFLLLKLYPINGIFNYFEKSILFSSIAGWLGSGVYMIRGFYQSTVGKDEDAFNFKWIWWYMSRPFLGMLSGFLAAIIIFSLFDLTESFNNQLVMFFISFLIGFNFHRFMKKRIEGKFELI